MNGSLDFTGTWWWGPLLAVPGLWLTARLYLRGSVRHRVPAALSAVAWLMLGLWAVSPVWRSRPEVWHPPLVILAVDESPGYAALGARDSGVKERRAARAHYEKRGFRVVETGFAGRLPGGAAHPNLQAVLLWSDGRDSGLATARASAPVYPVLTEVETGEVQGESVSVELRDEGPQGAVALTVAWRSLGTHAVDAQVGLYVEGKVVWTGIMSHPATHGAGGRVTTEVTLPASARDALLKDDAEPVALVKPAAAHGQVFSGNDTVFVNASRLNRMWQVFVRPVATLQERGLMDALREEPRFRVVAMSAAEARERAARGRTVVWLPAARVTPEVARFSEEGAGVVRYAFATAVEDPEARARGVRGAGGFGAEARIERAAEVGAFLPAGVLRLADLGFGREPAGFTRRELGREAAHIRPLAWAAEEGRRGLLFWRDLNSGEYGFIVPPLWDVRFQPEGGAGLASSGGTSGMTDWVHGAAWGVLMRVAAPGAARDGSDAGTRAVSTPPRPLARLGTDVEALARLAARHGGRILACRSEMSGARDFGVADSCVADAWPVLPDGQMRETRTRAYPLAPQLPVALALVLVLVCLWYLRKRRQLD